MTEVKECADDKKEGGQLLGTRKTKTTKTTLCAHQQDYHLVWFLGIMPCRCPGTDIHTYIHTYIHTLHTYRRIAASRAMLRWSSSVSSRTSIPTDSMPRKCKGRIRRSAYCPVCMYVCMYSFEYSQPAGKHANSYNPCMIQDQTLKPL